MRGFLQIGSHMHASNLLAGSIYCTLGSQKTHVSWNPVSDLIDFDIKEIANSLHLLKRNVNIVGFVSRFYDLLGFLFPVIVTLKSFLKSCINLRLINI